MSKSKSKQKQVSLKKVISSLEKTFSKAEKERETKQKWKNPGARIDEERFF
jgi:septal ring factor EnvC (AmiA/AmiB activator)